jgi:hypothetical protein
MEEAFVGTEVDDGYILGADESDDLLFCAYANRATCVIKNWFGHKCVFVSGLIADANIS